MKVPLCPPEEAANPVAMDFETLSSWADEELKALIKILPQDIQDASAAVAISLEEKPGHGAYDEELEGDELALFPKALALNGRARGRRDPRIRLFLINLWEWVGEEEHDYRDEVGTTFLHELGHYLGWDEDEVAERGLGMNHPPAYLRHLPFVLETFGYMGVWKRFSDPTPSSPAVMMRRIRGGIPAESFVETAEKLGISQELLAAKLGVDHPDSQPQAQGKRKSVSPRVRANPACGQNLEHGSDFV